jgi:hypothetical protein
MSNPDTPSSLTYAIPTSIIVCITVVMIFMLASTNSYINLIIYLGIPLIVYILIVIVNLLSQFISCNTVDIGKAFYYGLPGIGLTWLGLFISYFSWCRTPVASIFAPLFVSSNQPAVKNSGANSKNSCGSHRTLEYVESVAPVIKGLGYGFYLLFMTIFGVIIGNGFSAVC